MTVRRTISGALSQHPDAERLGHHASRVTRRYAQEVVLAHGLCPFLRDAESGLGATCVMVDEALDVEASVAFAISHRTPIHLLYPLCQASPRAFERFAAVVGEHVRQRVPVDAPVFAAFHPLLEGDPSSAPRLIGLLRRSPLPMLQFIEPGHHAGGTVRFDPESSAPAPAFVKPPSEVNFARLKGPALNQLLATIATIGDDWRTVLQSFKGFRTGE